MPERSRRSIAKSDKFKSLREVQSGIKSRKEQFQISDNIAIYDEVSEDEYRKINRDLLKKESFVIDDDGMGYGDGLLEDWEAENNISDEIVSDNEAKSTKKSKTSKSRTNPIQKTEITPSLNLERIESAFSRSTTQALMSSSLHSSSNTRPTRKAPKDASSFMENLLADFGSDDETSSTMGPMSKKPKLNSSRPSLSPYQPSSFHQPTTTSTSYSSTFTPQPMPSSSLSSTSPPSLPSFMPMQIDSPSLDANEPPNLNIEAISLTHTDPPESKQPSGTLTKESEVSLDNELLLQPMSSDTTSPPLFNVKKISTQRPTTTHIDLVSVPLTVPESKTLSPPTLTSYPPSKALEENGSLLFYFLDATEVKNSVYLFGKVKYMDQFVSCCLCISSMERNVFLLPREYKVENGVTTDVKVEPIHVYNEFTTLRTQYKIKKFASKFVERKYSFEVPNIPNEAVWLKLAYSFQDPALPLDFSGSTFSHAFGTHTSALELFVLKRKLMGPCWLRIEQPSMHAPSFSWCKFEGTVSNPKHVSVLKDIVPPLPPPPLTIMAISSKSYLNTKQQQEILILSTRVLSTTLSEDSKMEPVSHLTLLRPPPGAPPISMVRTNDIKVHQTEKSLLNQFMAHLQTQDPDVLLGHNLAGFDVDLLMNRLKSIHHVGWSKVGRLRRTQLPKSTMYRSCFSGRLMLDTYLASKELISSSKSYSLTYLAETQLKVVRPDLDYSMIRSYFDTHSQVQSLLEYSIQDCTLAIQLAQHLNALSLYKQLSTICGQLLSRTMVSGRAERNEYLLLHEFHKAKFIVPDKLFFTNSTSTSSTMPSHLGTDPFMGEDEMEELESSLQHDDRGFNDQESQTSSKSKSTTATLTTPPNPTKITMMDLKKRKKKSHYTGGLVLEPKRGFYDSFVLVLDFNSLYPSIIQEYNLCYTTVIRPLDGSMPLVPSPMQTGVLPKLIKSLVDRRKTVKKLMKECSLNERTSYNIRQLALKLTANSMYGCLGFMYSRFYCKPLAMLITKLGRDILQNTVDLALQSNLNVIYGDTDSIMIHTGSMELSYVKQQGKVFQEMVNKKYKYLEIEMDGFFERMLLLKKKKYAALIVEEQPNGTVVKRIESKGLDLVRRDWCGLSHDVSKFILHQLLESQESKEQVLIQIHDYLKETAMKLRLENGGYPLEAFIITKSLTKDPKLYTDPQPHVAVALAMEARGEPVSVGSTIPYVICSVESILASSMATSQPAAPGTSSALASRARHPNDLAKDPSLKLDIEWYLSQQVFPPVARLCSEIEGNEQAQLAECLGLDARKYDMYLGGCTKDMMERERTTLTSLLSIEERFSNTSPLMLTCLICSTSFPMSQSVNEELMQVGWTCPTCVEPLSLPTLTAQVIHSIRQHITKYENQWVQCDDASCACQSRSIRVYPTRCWRSPLCRGKVQFTYTANQLYKQLMYYAYLFEIESKLKPSFPSSSSSDSVRTEMSVVFHTYKDQYQTIRNVIQRYLDRNARTRVDLGSLFSFVSTSI